MIVTLGKPRLLAVSLRKSGGNAHKLLLHRIHHLDEIHQLRLRLLGLRTKPLLGNALPFGIQRFNDLGQSGDQFSAVVTPATNVCRSPAQLLGDTSMRPDMDLPHSSLYRYLLVCYVGFVSASTA